MALQPAAEFDFEQGKLYRSRAVTTLTDKLVYCDRRCGQ
jgi:hypothetical protein